MSRSLKPEFQEGGSRRQEIRDKAVEYIRDPKFGFQGDKHAFLVDQVGLSQTEYLSCLNQASNGAFLKAEMKDKAMGMEPGFSDNQDDWQLVRNGIDFFRQYFAKEYMVLLD